MLSHVLELTVSIQNSRLLQAFYKIGHVNNIPTMQNFTGISRNTPSRSSVLSLTECVWKFRNIALWDTFSIV